MIIDWQLLPPRGTTLETSGWRSNELPVSFLRGSNTFIFQIFRFIIKQLNKDICDRATSKFRTTVH